MTFKLGLSLKIFIVSVIVVSTSTVTVNLLRLACSRIISTTFYPDQTVQEISPTGFVILHRVGLPILCIGLVVCKQF